ncbi:Negative regulator of sexual conjugation and meiosis [Termitomyces sp. T112]|nr:Negative regulator of sexual conjugation and meiosis [Termitomyces sp. T112]
MSLKTTSKLQLGKRIDGNTLEFVEVLGVGGYGVVYKAVDVTTLEHTSYAVKCLLHSKDHRPNRRKFHIREIALHQISSAHPGIVTLHRIIEDDEYTYIIMDYAPDHDLFTQILNNCRYLGNDALIKHVFLQLVDAIEYCHSLGIYHRDLKPENILCFDNGYTVAITDFGLATTEKVSEELHTGSIYHMSPECQGGDFASDGRYSPKSNDVWSLGIILLNLATGRNPWKTATTDDLTFQAYLRDPSNFFPSVLPISLEINDILLQMLHIDWKQRITLSELRQQMEDITSFYTSDVVFEGSQARCSWEVTDTSKTVQEKELAPASQGLMSYWSENSSETDFGRDIHDAPVCNLLSPQVSDFLLGKQPAPKVFPNDIPEIRSHSTSSSYSHQSYSSTPQSYISSPLTLGSNEREFVNSTLVEIAIDDAFEETMPHEDNTLIETGLVPSMSSSRFLKVPRPGVGVRITEESSWYTPDASQPAPPWAIVPKLKTSLTPKSSGLESSTPSPDFSESEWRLQTPTIHEIDSPCNDKFGFNPMKLFSRSSRFASSIPKDTTSTSCKARCTQETSGSNKSGIGGEKDVEALERRWRLGRFSSAKNWFLPQKLFVSTAAS